VDALADVIRPCARKLKTRETNATSNRDGLWSALYRKQDPYGIGSWKEKSAREAGSDSSMAGWLRSAGRRVGCPHPTRRRRYLRIPNAGTELLRQLRCRFGDGNVQGATTSVDVAQSNAATAVKLRSCPDGQSERGERLEGEPSPREHRAGCGWQHLQSATDSMVEQSLEVEDRDAGNSGSEQRREGKDCGDAARLPAREKLRRV